MTVTEFLLASMFLIFFTFKMIGMADDISWWSLTMPLSALYAVKIFISIFNDWRNKYGN